jgi:hypothetical protein
MSTEAPKRRPLRSGLAWKIVEWPWDIGAGLARLFYGFRFVGKERIPREGPAIIWLNEMNPFGPVICGWIIVKGMGEVFTEVGDENVFYTHHEDLFTFKPFRKIWESQVNRKDAGVTNRPLTRPLSPASAGQLALGLLDGYRVLMNKGFAVVNPEGDAPWDGRPLPIGRSLPWWALRTAATIVPIFSPTSVYDSWPRWQALPYRGGHWVLEVGQPFKLCDEPLQDVTPEDMARADARLRQVFATRYGPRGISDWAGPILRHGAPVEGPVEIETPTGPLAAVPPPDPKVKLSALGVPTLLHQCPVCGTNDALLHKQGRRWPQTVSCQACGTRWEFRRVISHDFRLKVVAGPEELVGLEMPLCYWYDEMRRKWQPKPIHVPGVELLPDEVVYLEKCGVSLAPHHPNPLFEEWGEREAPKRQVGSHEWGDWQSIGDGQLLLTNQRLLWRGEERELDFMWPSVTAINIFMTSTLGIRYGAAWYRFRLGNARQLQWEHHASYFGRRAAQVDGHPLTVRPPVELDDQAF